MATTRQDAWTDEEDLLLAEVVLRHIKDGGTQLSAFHEVGRHLSRTSAACGFRWNSYVRKQYKNQIEAAKHERKTNAVQAHAHSYAQLQLNDKDITIDHIIAYLQEYKEQKRDNYYERVLELEQQTKQLREEKEYLLEQLSIYEQEYEMLFDFIEKKRNVVTTEREKKVHRLRERNVLEKVEK